MKTTRRSTVHTFSVMEVMMMMSLMGTLALWTQQHVQMIDASFTPAYQTFLLNTDSQQMMMEIEEEFAGYAKQVKTFFSLQGFVNKPFSFASPLLHPEREKLVNIYAERGDSPQSSNFDMWRGLSPGKFLLTHRVESVNFLTP
jgi:hypothetical protein